MTRSYGPCHHDKNHQQNPDDDDAKTRKLYIENQHLMSIMMIKARGRHKMWPVVYLKMPLNHGKQGF